MKPSQIYPYSTPDGIIQLVPLADFEKLNGDLEAEQEKGRCQTDNIVALMDQLNAAMNERDQLRADVAMLNGRLIERTSGMLSKQTELTQEARKARSVARRALDYLENVAQVFQSVADDGRFNFRDRSNMQQCAKRVRTEVKPLRAELEAFDALTIRPNAAECGQCADNATSNLAPGEG